MVDGSKSAWLVAVGMLLVISALITIYAGPVPAIAFSLWAINGKKETKA